MQSHGEEFFEACDDEDGGVRVTGRPGMLCELLLLLLFPLVPDAPDTPGP